MSVTCKVCNNRVFGSLEDYEQHVRDSQSHQLKARSQVVSTSATPPSGGTANQRKPSPTAVTVAPIPDPLGQAQCLKCDMRFKDHDAVLLHRKAAHPMVKCLPCERVVYQEELQVHWTESDKHPNCEECAIGFRDDAMLRQHQQVSHKFRCTTCTKEFSSKKELEDHRHPQCSRCPKSFVDNESLDKHMERVHPSLFCKACQDNVFVADVHDHYKDSANHPKCTLCGIGLIDDAAFREHAIHQHLDLYCQTCSVLVDSMDQMQLHYHEMPEIHPLCGSCQRAFKDQSVYDEHMREAHATPVFSCTTCCISVTSEDELQQHYRETGPPIHAWCRRCEEAFATDEELAVHNRASHTMIRCEVCRVYVDTEELAQHWNEAPEALHPSCTVCGMGFENQTIYLSHAFETHPELCCDTCFLAFKTLYELQDHFREYKAVHENCPHCGEGFRNDVELFEHLEIHQSQSETDSTHSDAQRYKAKSLESTISNASLATQQILQYGGETPSDNACDGRSTTSSVEPPAPSNSSSDWEDIGIMKGGSMGLEILSETASTGAASQGVTHDSDSERDSSFVTPRASSPAMSQNEIGEPIQLPLSHAEEKRVDVPCTGNVAKSQQDAVATSRTSPADTTRAKYFLSCRSCLQGPEEPVAATCGHIYCHRCFIQQLAQYGRCTVCDTVFLVRLLVDSVAE